MCPDKIYEVEPVTRLEGHGGLRLVLGEDGKTVKDVQFNITSTRFFEKLLGPTGLHILRKVFGIILLAIAIKLFISRSCSNDRHEPHRIN